MKRKKVKAVRVWRVPVLVLITSSTRAVASPRCFFPRSLKKLSGSNVIVTLRSKNDTDIAVAAWGRLDTFNLDNGAFNPQRIKDFISRYQNQGPESLSGLSGHIR